ncbi:MAG: hypothetical protein ACJAVK_000695 [Akkermansiaceae bacterium]|jgi:hypothetical protein
MNKIQNYSLGLTLMSGLAAHAELILLEQFEYEGNDAPLAGSDGGSGFESPWEVTGWSRGFDIGRTAFALGDSSAIINERGGLDFTDHPSAGTALTRYGTAGQREANRPLTEAAQAALTADDTTIWFSILACAPSGNKFGTMIFGTDILTAVQGSAINGNLTAETGQAFGFGFRSDNGGIMGGGSGSPNAVAFVDSASATVEVGTYVPPLEEGASHHQVSLVAGKINWKPDGTADELFLFNIGPDSQSEPAEADAIATITADFAQADFDVISLQDTGATIFDEIRFGTTFIDVAPGVAPVLPLSITAFDYSTETGEISLSWNSLLGVSYIVRYSTDLQDWDNDIEDGIPADDGESTTKSFFLSDFGLDSETPIFFRIEAE